MLVDDRLVPRVYAQAREPAHSGLNPVIMPYFHSTFDLAMTRVLGSIDLKSLANGLGTPDNTPLDSRLLAEI